MHLFFYNVWHAHILWAWPWYLLLDSFISVNSGGLILLYIYLFDNIDDFIKWQRERERDHYFIEDNRSRKSSNLSLSWDYFSITMLKSHCDIALKKILLILKSCAIAIEFWWLWFRYSCFILDCFWLVFSYHVQAKID